MRYYLLLASLLVSFQMSAQLSVGSSGMTVLSGTSVNIDGLTLTPSANLTIANNSIQRTSTPLAGKPSINRLYQFGSPLLFSGTVGLFYLPTELNGYGENTLQLAYTSTPTGPLLFSPGSSVNTSTHYVSKTLTNQNLLVVTASAQADLTPTIYARPSTTAGLKPVSVVVEVYELNGAPSHGPLTVKLAKDPKVLLSFTPDAVSVGGKTVQNSAWSFDGTSDEDYYVLTSNQGVAAGDVLSVGLTGTLNPGATSGSVVFTTVVGPGSGNEVQVLNNTDADKVEYFQQ